MDLFNVAPMVVPDARAAEFCPAVADALPEAEDEASESAATCANAVQAHADVSVRKSMQVFS
jgi:hypothetical protein